MSKDENNNNILSENQSDSGNNSENSTPYRDNNTYVERTERQDDVIKK